ncbi:hypothetical protein DPMN_023964 [Dreissena polymorpha]|uniref:Uncharacterized protein n=1 Tax=Dreissena polymorpha TaxID=45954 RepID=A0A9D4LM44_DREPO|nr:hypothetical protein DPMN_023964 [Dreissena polymorpha]
MLVRNARPYQFETDSQYSRTVSMPQRSFAVYGKKKKASNILGIGRHMTMGTKPSSKSSEHKQLHGVFHKSIASNASGCHAGGCTKPFTMTSAMAKEHYDD